MQTPTYAYPTWFLGLDLGQRQDHTALATIELFWTCTGRDPVSFEHIFNPTLNLCGLRRFRLGTEYTKYPSLVARHVNRLPYNGAPIYLVIDAGGPGAPVVDEIRRGRIPARVTPMLITGGDSPGYATNGYSTVPRRELISNLVLLVEHKLLRWPENLPQRAALDYELLQLNAGTTHPDTVTAHDDLVMAVAIAVWHAKTVSPRIFQGTTPTGRRNWSPQGPLF